MSSRSSPTRPPRRSTSCCAARSRKSRRLSCPPAAWALPTRNTKVDRAHERGRAKYVAIITDGNGRWAAERGLPPIEGHRAGADVVKARLRDAVELGVEELSV